VGDAAAGSVREFEKTATRAGIALGCPPTVPPVEFWLGCISQDLRPDSPGVFARTAEGGMLQELIRLSACCVLRLATAADEEAHRTAGDAPPDRAACGPAATSPLPAESPAADHADTEAFDEEAGGFFPADAESEAKPGAGLTAWMTRLLTGLSAAGLAGLSMRQNREALIEARARLSAGADDAWNEELRALHHSLSARTGQTTNRMRRYAGRLFVARSH
jgi:hypothetical protein